MISTNEDYDSVPAVNETESSSSEGGCTSCRNQVAQEIFNTVAINGSGYVPSIQNSYVNTPSVLEVLNGSSSYSNQLFNPNDFSDRPNTGIGTGLDDRIDPNKPKYHLDLIPHRFCLYHYDKIQFNDNKGNLCELDFLDNYIQSGTVFKITVTVEGIYNNERTIIDEVFGPFNSLKVEKWFQPHTTFTLNIAKGKSFTIDVEIITPCINCCGYDRAVVHLKKH